MAIFQKSVVEKFLSELEESVIDSAYSRFKEEYNASRINEIKTINTDEAYELSKDNKCNLIDIRDIRELEKEGRVENSHHIPRGMLEFWQAPESPYFKEGKLDSNKEMVLFCAGGLRSALATKSL